MMILFWSECIKAVYRNNELSQITNEKKEEIYNEKYEKKKKNRNKKNKK